MNNFGAAFLVAMLTSNNSAFRTNEMYGVANLGLEEGQVKIDGVKFTDEQLAILKTLSGKNKKKYVKALKQRKD